MPRHALFTEGSSGGKHRLVDETHSGGQHKFFGGPVTYVGSTAGPTATAWSSWSVTPAVGDLIVVSLTSRGVGTTWTTPAGYTLARASSTSDLNVTSYWKFATSTEVSGGPGTFTPSANAGYGVGIASTWRGASVLAPIADAGEVNWINQPQLAGVADGIYLAYIGWGWNDVSAPGFNPPLNSNSIATALNGNASWGMAAYMPLTATVNPQPHGSSDYTASLGTSASALMSQGLILAPA